MPLVVWSAYSDGGALPKGEFQHQFAKSQYLPIGCVTVIMSSFGNSAQIYSTKKVVCFWSMQW